MQSTVTAVDALNNSCNPPHAETLEGVNVQYSTITQHCQAEDLSTQFETCSVHCC